MVKRIVFVLLLFVGTWCDATFAWARGGSLVTPPTEMVGQIRVVDRTRNRIVMEERDLEVWATDQRQLEGLAPGRRFGSAISNRTASRLSTALYRSSRLRSRAAPRSSLTSVVPSLVPRRPS